MSSNPFATRFIRPGALAFRFARGDSAEALLERFRATGSRGQIVGPHGSGKSTLLETLRPLLAEQFPHIAWLQLKAGPERRQSQRAWKSLPARDRQALIVIDGYEQAYAWNRWWLARQTRQGAALLVTSHFPLGKLPVLYETTTSADLARELIAELLGDTTQDANLTADVPARLAAHGGNLRELLFELYDRYGDLEKVRQTVRFER